MSDKEIALELTKIYYENLPSHEVVSEFHIRDTYENFYKLLSELETKEEEPT